MVDFPLLRIGLPWGKNAIDLINNALSRIQSAVEAVPTDGDKGDITVSSTGTVWTIDNNAVTDAKLRDSGPLSVIGRAANSTGDPADISASAASGAVLRESGSTLGFGTIATAGIADDAVTNAKIADPCYDVVCWLGAAPTANQVLLFHKFARTVVFPSSLTGSQGHAKTAATAQTDFDIQKNGSSVGTMRFAASGTTPSFIFSSQQTFSAGDRLDVIAPGSPDATLASITFTLKGEKS